MGAISTSIVLILGMAMVVPAFIFASTAESEKLRVLIQIEIVEDDNLPFWCSEFNEKLEDGGIKSVVFLTGEIAESNPECIFNVSGVDVGNQGYRYHDITQISDYSQQLSEIKKGKTTIDNLGGFESKVFKAPFGSTDENIYSLLDKSGILGDFSYSDHYNLFVDDQFVKFDLLTVDNVKELDSIDSLQIVTFSFNNLESVDSIFNTVDEINKYPILFVNPSDLYGESLTLKR
jgi:hypothetical protein